MLLNLFVKQFAEKCRVRKSQDQNQGLTYSFYQPNSRISFCQKMFCPSTSYFAATDTKVLFFDKNELKT